MNPLQLAGYRKNTEAMRLILANTQNGFELASSDNFMIYRYAMHSRRLAVLFELLNAEQTALNDIKKLKHVLTYLMKRYPRRLRWFKMVMDKDQSVRGTKGRFSAYNDLFTVALDLRRFRHMDAIAELSGYKRIKFRRFMVKVIKWR